jgi:hypothetical protein
MMITFVWEQNWYHDTVQQADDQLHINANS